MYLHWRYYAYSGCRDRFIRAASLTHSELRTLNFNEL